MTAPDGTHLMNTYARKDIAFARGEGMYLVDDKGRRYLDFYAGIAVNALGHSHPHFVQAIQEQAAKLMHVTNLYRIPEGETLAARLCESSFADVVFFCNSGAEALEGMIKMARRYHYVAGHPEKTRIITCSGAFHGRTMMTISAANNPKYLEGFGPAMDGFDSVPFGNMNALRDAISDETAAILLEPVQGEGGIRPADLDFLRDVRAACDEYGLLMILDEVQSGNGRTGKMWAHEWADIAPDALATAKGLGGGFPLGAFLATDQAASGLVPGVHGTTFGGNPLAMAAGNAVLDVVLGDGFLEEVDRVARRLWHKLVDLCAAHPSVYENVRGAGLMLGLVCNATAGTNNADVGDRLLAHGLMTVGAADNVVRLLPPLIVEDGHVDEALMILEKVAREIEEAQNGA